MKKTVGEIAIESAITVGSATVGGAVGVYVGSHDLLNVGDQDLQMIAGVTSGALTYTLMRGALMGVKDRVTCQAPKQTREQERVCRKAKAEAIKAPQAGGKKPAKRKAPAKKKAKA